MAEWLKGCEVCNAGLCERFDELISQGMSQRQAAKELENDQKEKLGEVIYPGDTLRKRFSRMKGGTSVPPPKKAPEDPKPYTNAVYLAGIAISQLERITPGDPKRKEAFQKIINWINEQLKEAAK